MIIMIGYMFCQDPSSWYAYFLSVFQAGSGFTIIVAMQGYALKRVPKMIRGIILALIAGASSFGSIVYLQISKQFYESAPNMVFGWMGIFDGFVLIMIVIAVFLGYYGNPPPQEDTFGEGNSMKQENQTADFIKDEDYIDDDIEPVPMYQDIYDEHIPEMSSSYEASSFHTRRHKFGSKAFDDNELASSARSGEDIYMGSVLQSRAKKSFHGTDERTKELTNHGSKIVPDDLRTSTLNRGDSFESPDEQSPKKS